MSVSMSKRERRPKWFAVAHQWWPNAYSIEGKDGPFAVVIACRPEVVIVSLYPTESEAIWKLTWVTFSRCGGRCRGFESEWHEFFDLRGVPSSSLLSNVLPVPWPPLGHGYPVDHGRRLIFNCPNTEEELKQMSPEERVKRYVISSVDLVAKYGGAR